MKTVVSYNKMAKKVLSNYSLGIVAYINSWFVYFWSYKNERM